MLLSHLLGLVLQVVELAHCGLRFGRRLWRPSLTAPTPCRPLDALPGVQGSDTSVRRLSSSGSRPEA
jgi:hypothetical protein